MLITNEEGGIEMLKGRGLWRAKRKGNGEWIEGAPYDKYMICGMDLTFGDEGVPMSEYPEFDWIEIAPSTLGECTGLTDKHGVKIFEGDIIRYITKEHSSIYIVGWNAEAACFVVYGLGFYSLGLGEKFPIGDFTFFDPQKCEVLGNVHDNSELLGGDD